VLHRFDLGEVHRVKDALGRMQAPELRSHRFVDDLIIGDGGFPAHPSQQSNGFHGFHENGQPKGNRLDTGLEPILNVRRRPKTHRTLIPMSSSPSTPCSRAFNSSGEVKASKHSIGVPFSNRIKRRNLGDAELPRHLRTFVEVHLAILSCPSSSPASVSSDGARIWHCPHQEVRKWTSTGPVGRTLRVQTVCPGVP
jgi:hypothetical protein